MSKRSSLDDFIVQVRAAQDRGLPISAGDVLDGLAYAISRKRDNDPVPFGEGVQFIEDRVRRWQTELDRRFGQPHFGHGIPDIEYIWREPKNNT